MKKIGLKLLLFAQFFLLISCNLGSLEDEEELSTIGIDPNISGIWANELGSYLWIDNEEDIKICSPAVENTITLPWVSNNIIKGELNPGSGVVIQLQVDYLAGSDEILVTPSNENVYGNLETHDPTYYYRAYEFPCEDYYETETGVFTDSRDGKTYDLFRMGSLWWMTENFDYDYQGSLSSSTYWSGQYKVDGSGNFIKSYNSYYTDKAYPSHEDEASRKGKLYTYDAAVNAAPDHWRLPKSDDYWGLLHSTHTQAFIDNISFSDVFWNWANQEVDGTPTYAGGGNGFWTSTPTSQAYYDANYKEIPAYFTSTNSKYDHAGINVRYVIDHASFLKYYSK